MRFRLDTVATETAKHLDQRFTPYSRQFAYRLHFNVALLALAGIPDLLGHPARLCAKPVGRMNICPVRLRPPIEAAYWLGLGTMRPSSIL